VAEDPRIALREDVPDAAELAAITAAVAKLDASKRTGPWTRLILEWIREHPGVISTELAALLGREVAPMKADIRRLKALGLTESLRVGYRLSPRGTAYLESLE
jgi:predicted transcriptional regulator